MFHQVPFLGFVVFYALGITVGHSVTPANTNWQWYCFSITILLAFSLLLAFKRRSRVLTGVLLNLILMTAGFFQSLAVNRHLSNLRQKGQSPHDYFSVLIKSLPEKRTRSLRFQAEVQQIRGKNGWHNFRAPVLFSISTDAEDIPAPGDHVMVKGKLKRPNAPLNPYEFDYAQYLWDGGITLTGFAETGNYALTASSRRQFNWRYAHLYVSAWADQVFRNNIHDDLSYGLIKAVILGRRDDLRSEQVEDFKIAGAIHILSVSGLHVGIIFLIIGKLLGWLKRFSRGRILYPILVAAILCFYAMVTGLPSSVVRATIMCMVFLTAEMYSRDNVPMNTLSLSGFIILLFDPFALFNIGFQLTYLAMAGIFMFYRKFRSSFTFKSRLGQYVWDVTSLAFAAQITTFPVMVYAFHQFPTYFWLFNPLIVFFIDMALNASLAILVFSALHIDILTSLAGFVAEGFGMLTNAFASWTQLLPLNRIENLTFSVTEVIFLYAIMTLAWISWHYADIRFLKYTTAAVICFMLIGISTDTQRYLTNEAYAFSIPRHSVLGFKRGNKLHILADDEFRITSPDFNFHVYNYAVNAGVLEVTDSPVEDNFLRQTRGEHRIVFWDDQLIYMGPRYSHLGNFDYVLLTKSSSGSEVTSFGSAGVLLGGTISKKKRLKIVSDLAAYNISCKDLSEGSFQF